MGKKSFKTILASAAVALALSGAGVGAAAPVNAMQTPKLAELVGDFDFSSSAKKTVIVELTEPSIVEAKQKGQKQSKANLSKARNQVKSQVAKAVKNAKINREYDHVFSGFSVELPEEGIPALLAMPGVKAVYPDVTYTVTSVGEVEAVSEEVFSPEMFDSAPFIGSDEAWETGFTGEGVTVAVIDTGADYTHPDLAHAFGENKGYDFVDNDKDPQETPAGDPRGESTQHGTHVSGTVAANGKIKGVAPDAELLAYRVLGPGGSGTTQNVIAGIEKAVEDGADVMNLSLGNSLNDPDYATSIALDWAMSEGVVAITSNGNSGPNNWTVGSPGTSRDAISVGATQLPFNLYDSTLSTSEGVSYPSAKVMGFPSDEELLALSGKEYEFVDVGFGAPEDFEGKDLIGKIALISRGGFAFVDKATNAKNAGAVGAIIYNNLAGEHADVPGMAVPTIKTTQEDGQKLLAELEAGNNKVLFNIEFDSEVGESMADFSSRGPVTGTWMIKPDVSAPGVNITSTVPTHDPANPYGYAAMQGTSMAAPHVAGAAALILDANPEWGVDDVKAALMNTAADVINPSTGKPYPHNSQGAGSIRVVDAINTETLAAPGSHSFGTFLKTKGKQVEKQQFTIKNLSAEKKNYSFEVNMGEYSDAIKVSTSNNLKVNPGKSQNVNLNVKVDAGQLAPGYYEGSITINDGEAAIDVPTILFVQEPDYPRAEYLAVSQQGENFQIQGLFPGGAEQVNFFVYTSDSKGAVGEYLGTFASYEEVPAGYSTFEWDGVVNGQKLQAGNYYNLYVQATYKNQTDTTGVNFLVR
ncbi:minor extracellular serine protease Vpr [Mesobacillus persicus]|uniref:Minor extracellular serine protease Vpr n=1 Tax=Mesobacillus persicus TaxID=930146 RepID=A0A1H8CPY8_9BACI|nr:S8 family serine peptidase [Mesobacillus persicus]SEM97070.1 minor extracellular serine protease Vpr [Mesobacillus persicus]